MARASGLATPKRRRREGGLTVYVTDEMGRPVRVPRRSGAAAKAGLPRLASWLRRAAPAGTRGSVTVALVSDARMRGLNRAYRRKDYATDVLSFHAGANGFRTGSAGLSGPRSAALHPTAHNPRGGDPGLKGPPYGHQASWLGDIVIARGVATRQARDLGHTAAVELRVLALHGLLHLLGYDHERDRGRMRTLEQRLLRRSGLGEGLIERARPSTSSGRALSSRAGGRGRQHARGEPVEPRAER